MNTNRLSLCRTLALAALVAACADTPTQPSPDAPQFSEVTDVAGTYLVRFNGGIPADFASRVFAFGGEVIFAHQGAGIAAVAGLIPSAAEALGATSGIAGVDPDAYVELDEPATLEIEAAEPASPANPAGAFFFARRQWNLTAIGAHTAWAAGHLGSANVKVGILDTGIDYAHPDLAGRVDLALSRSFLSAAENARVQTAFPGAHEIADLHYHGTHVSSTVVSNAFTNAGVTSGVTLVGLKVCAPGTAPAWRGTCPTSGTLSAILYAADNGIPIINMSLGGSFLRRNASAAGGFGPSFLATINQVFNYAYRNGTLVVVSAGNSAADMDHDGNSYKSYCTTPNVVCVSATGPTAGQLVGGFYQNVQNVDALAGYSNYGRSSVTVAAPGGNFLPVWATCSKFSLPFAVCATGNFTLGASGTSMAAPHVSGVAALIASTGVSGPAAIRARLQQTADDLGQPGVDPAYGSGRVNAARAVGL
ncbi:MAG TPA: S8 family serine peptidase [Longimicrobiales bacterium]|nr:S8 family serine peptidase [Longimicrobiales bacterium]